MSYSKMTEMVSISPFRNSPRNMPIKKITWHHMAGVLSLEQFRDIVQSPGRNMSATYAIDKDGRIGLFCPEEDRPWTSSSANNDNQAITFEISNSKNGEPWPISDYVMQRAIELTADCCVRNNIPKLEFNGGPSGSFTCHYMFAATGCPGPYIRARIPEIVDKINKRINEMKGVKPAQPAPKPQTQTTSTTQILYAVGDLVSISSNATYYDGKSVPEWVKKQKWYISSISSDRAVLGKNEAGNQNIQSAMSTKYLTLAKENVAKEPTFTAYTLYLDKNTQLFKTPGDTKVTGVVGVSTKYTIIGEKVVNNVKYCQLKSGAGWVKYPTQAQQTQASNGITVGCKVKVLNGVQYNGIRFTVYEKSYTVLEVKGDRAVISSDGKNVTCAINTSNIQKI